MTIGCMPTVNWRGYKISRLILGHNPIKGHAHLSQELDAEMEDWFSNRANGVDLLRRCLGEGINTVQFGRGTFDILGEAAKQSVSPNWIATLYDDPNGCLGTGRYSPKTVEEEFEEFEKVPANLIGYQHFGESTDLAFFEDRMNEVSKTIDWLRKKDDKRLIGVCTHLPQVVRVINKEKWPIDFLQTSFYTVYSNEKQKRIDRNIEVFDPSDRDKMLEAINGTDYPCIAFKVLASGRDCQTPEQVRDSLAYCLKNIKENDIVCIGMWQKHEDQARQNARHFREIFGPKEAAKAN
jgi:hypothetical protein